MPRIWIKECSFTDDTKVTFEKSDIILIVGPNNSGKSATLRAIRDKLAKNVANPVVSAISFVREGGVEEVIAWLDDFAHKKNPFSENLLFQALGSTVPKINIPHFWNDPSYVHELARFFCHLLTADERLQAANPANNINMMEDPCTHPIHFLYRDDRLEKRLSTNFHKVFGEELILNRSAGNNLPLHVGVRPIPNQGQDRASFEYVSAVAKLPFLHTQGDGMRSFTGVLLYTLVGHESILMIDEPEAFLHPPQARQLGRILVEDKPDERQLFVATHSGDILRGVLDAGSSKVRVVRIRRNGNVNHVRELNNAKVAELWNDPLLRYSNILDGLFHEKVVVCEGDADARFYSAVADSLIDPQGENVRRPDVMFVHCGGKDRIPMVVRALREVDVPVSIAVDFDILSSEQPLRDIVQAAGGDWNTFETDWVQIYTAINSKKPELSSVEVIKDVKKVLAEVNDPIFPMSAKGEIGKIFRRSSPWATAKSVGKTFIPSGDPTKIFERLINSLKEYGIHIVEVGEVESFVRSVGNHGPRWVNEALKKDLRAEVELESARKFVTELLA